jgi:hypothetical protein
MLPFEYTVPLNAITIRLPHLPGEGRGLSKRTLGAVTTVSQLDRGLRREVP